MAGNTVALIGFTLDIMENFEDSSLNLRDETYKATLHILNNERVQKELKNALSRELGRLIKTNLSFPTVTGPGAEYFNLYLNNLENYSQATLHTNLMSSITESDFYQNLSYKIERTLSELKEANTGLFFKDNKWVYIVAATVIDGVALYYAKKSNENSLKYSKKFEGEKFKLDSQTVFGQLKLRSKILELNPYANRVKIGFDELSLSWDNGEKLKDPNYRAASINLSTIGTYDGALFFDDPHIMITLKYQDMALKLVKDEKNIYSSSLKLSNDFNFDKLDFFTEFETDFQTKNKSINLGLDNDIFNNSLKLKYEFGDKLAKTSAEINHMFDDNTQITARAENDLRSKNNTFTLEVRLKDLQKSLDEDTTGLDIKHSIGNNEETSIYFFTKFTF